MKLFQLELEELADWFARAYPMGTMDIHVGVNTKDKYEEYHIEFKVDGKKFGSEFRIPPGWEEQDTKYIYDLRTKFLDLQKKKIASAVQKVLNGSTHPTIGH